MWSQIVAALAMFGLGALWYSPKMFAKPWMELTGLKDKEMRSTAKTKMAMMYSGALFASFVAASALKMVMLAMNAQTLFSGIVVGLMVGLAFVFTSFSTAYGFSGRPRKLLLIDAGYQVAGFVLMGAIQSYFV